MPEILSLQRPISYRWTVHCAEAGFVLQRALRDSSSAAPGEIVVSVVMPCLNEARGVAICVEKARRALAAMGVCGEVVVVDNGSTDGSAEIAARAGARVVHEPLRGYSAAYLRRFHVSRDHHRLNISNLKTAGDAGG